jgi:hypothetical protein
MTDREKILKLIDEAKNKDFTICNDHPVCKDCPAKKDDVYCHEGIIADHLIANGVTLQQWIPVTERLPETGGYYLVHQMNPKFRTSFIQHARYSETKERWLGAQAMCSLDYVTHWMPLPNPPKGENE